MEDNLIIDTTPIEPTLELDNQETIQEEVSEEKQPINVDAILGQTPLAILFAELNSGAQYSSHEVINKLFAGIKVAFGNCWNSALPEVAMIHFNQVGLGFSILQKILMTRHGVVPQEQMPPQPRSNLIQL